jgi:uncharacterized protein YmfQ (DUF2313 family)
MERILQALTYLLPQGFAWPRDPDSTLMRVLRGIAGSFHELQQFIEQTVSEWQPATTTTRLAEWEQATGLPDKCFGVDQDIDTRRQLLLMRLRGPELPLEDSSPAAPAVIEALCLSIGYVATVAYNTPLRCGHRIGERLGVLDGVLHVTVTLPGHRMRMGERVGSRLITGPTAHELACLLQRMLPARYRLNMILV